MINIRTNIQSKESKLIQEESTESSEHSKGTCGNGISSRSGIAHGSCLGTEKVRQAGPELFCAWLGIAVGKRLESTREVASIQISGRRQRHSGISVVDALQILVAAAGGAAVRIGVRNAARGVRRGHLVPVFIPDSKVAWEK